MRGVAFNPWGGFGQRGVFWLNINEGGRYFVLNWKGRSLYIAFLWTWRGKHHRLAFMGGPRFGKWRKQYQ